MPIWKFHHHPDIFTDNSERLAIARAATAFYVSHGIPDYYVNIQFFPLTPNEFYTGGNPISTTVFVEITHVARHWDPTDNAAALRMKDSFDKILMPYTTDRGLHLEYCVHESPAALWRINGIDPPESFGPDDQEQAVKNRARLNQLRANPK
ncbi:uncharacterized protein RCC_03672 [Ramularia collo-cygni]|uniref:Tautomerase cis-CaaD-like domain-containing protein n=1 Tax=Ramularia collo-cygni TaxID=112498 RepID=A0A2D3V2S3_9PEZI|nr:uncharacterized protein RCC_03672 [Ramularia collo-cygni]CZT17836.1 uncharacterized protein RCC_03672 [Ramularia collo-cygni]